MKYLGGKSKIAKYIIPFINNSIFSTGYNYLEPFVGANNITRYIDISCDMICSDSHQGLITMYRALQDGWIPPKNLSKNEYILLKEKNDQYNPLTAFAAFGCSFSGKEWGGYAQGDNRNFCDEARRSLLKMISDPSFKDVKFQCCNYLDYKNIQNKVIYCDPPYEGTTKYKQEFNHEEFWDWCNEKSYDNILYVSEMTLPPPNIMYSILWQKSRKISVSLENYKEKTEYLFKIGSL